MTDTLLRATFGRSLRVRSSVERTLVRFVEESRNQGHIGLRGREAGSPKAIRPDASATHISKSSAVRQQPSGSSDIVPQGEQNVKTASEDADIRLSMEQTKTPEFKAWREGHQ